YPGRIKGVFGAKTAENSRKPVFGFRLSGGKGILQRSHPVIFTKTENQKQQPEIRHSRAGGNPDPQRGRNLSEITETGRT
ncbi:TPA: hypothetical protein ACNYXI_000757, partial [Neisseria meningitidis]